MARRHCHPHGTCKWTQTRSMYEVCEVCRDVFPCRKACTHNDCIECRIEHGRALPGDWAMRDSYVCRWPVKGLPFTDELP